MISRSRRAYRSKPWLVSVALLLVTCAGCQWMSKGHATQAGDRRSQRPPVADSGWVDATPPVGTGVTQSDAPVSTGWIDPSPPASQPNDKEPNDFARTASPARKDGAARRAGVQTAAPARLDDGGSTVLAPGDAIEVKFYYTPDLDVNQVIRPDGNISMQLLGEVRAAGKTPVELENEMTGQYGWHLKNPRISVIVRGLVNRRVYVGGQVTKPGIIQMPGPMTAVEAVIEAGGFIVESAKPENVLVIRFQDGKRQVFCIDLMLSLGKKKAPKGAEASPFFLQAKDVIYVPETRIVQVDRFVDQHINQLIPKFIYAAWYPFGSPYR
jgi:polysaccharide biosynthesis/export protein